MLATAAHIVSYAPQTLYVSNRFKYGDKNKEIKIIRVCLRGQHLAAASCRVESGRKRWGQYLAGSSLEGV